jgi:4-amino-4-deoxy-L-arabinose transferase-like glycosyltransferase
VTTANQSARSDPSWLDVAWKVYCATWERRAWLLIGALTLVRFAVAGATTLSDTESYYVGWARHPALSYYDHPPLVAWTTWCAEQFGRSALAVRFVPVVCAAIFAMLIMQLTTRLFSARAAFIAVATVLALPAFEMTSFLVNPEGLLAPLWALYLILLHDLTDHDEPWKPLALGALIGVAFLAKYTALLGVPVALVYLASSARTRRWFRRPSLYLGGLVALVIASPVIAWNQARHWPSVMLHLVERAAPATFATYVDNALHTVGSQWVLFHPLIFPGLVVTAWLMFRRAKHDERYRFLAWVSLPVLAFFFVMMVRVRDAEPHWTMVGYVPVIIAAGGLIDSVIDRSASLRFYVGASAMFSIALLGVYFVHMRTPELMRAIPASVYDANADPVNETLGWDEIRDAVVGQASRLGPGTVVASSHNVLCGHLQEALDDAPHVYCASPRRTEFDFVGRSQPPSDAPVVYVDSARYPLDPSAVLPSRQCEVVDRVDVKRGDRIVNEIHIFACAPAPSALLQAQAQR